MPDNKTSAAQRAATDRYLEKFDEVRIRIPKGQKVVLQTHAAAQGESVNAFVIRAIEQTIKDDKEQAKEKEYGKEKGHE